jgi:hypothetical protein
VTRKAKALLSARISPSVASLTVATVLPSMESSEVTTLAKRAVSSPTRTSPTTTARPVGKVIVCSASFTVAPGTN